VVAGDSIARGNDATVPSRSFISLWADDLHDRYGSRVTVTNHSNGGYTIQDAYVALRRFRTLGNHDLVALAVGVNDAAQGMPVRKFKRLLGKIAARVENRGLDLLVVTPLRPANADVAPYVDAIRQSGLPVADVNRVWGDTPLANGINHPDDGGHRLYANVLLEAVAERIPGRAGTPASVG